MPSRIPPNQQTKDKPMISYSKTVKHEFQAVTRKGTHAIELTLRIESENVYTLYFSNGMFGMSKTTRLLGAATQSAIGIALDRWLAEHGLNQVHIEDGEFSSSVTAINSIMDREYP